MSPAKIAKWYHVLVVGGASLLSDGCGSAESQAIDGGPPHETDVESNVGNVESLDASATRDAAVSAGMPPSSITAQNKNLPGGPGGVPPRA